MRAFLGLVGYIVTFSILFGSLWVRDIYAEDSVVKPLKESRSKMSSLSESYRLIREIDSKEISQSSSFTRKELQELVKGDAEARSLNRAYKPNESILYSCEEIEQVPAGYHEDGDYWIYGTLKIAFPDQDGKSNPIATTVDRWADFELGGSKLGPNFYHIGWSLENSGIYAANNNSINGLQLGDCIVIAKERPARILSVKEFYPDQGKHGGLRVGIHLVTPPTIRKNTLYQSKISRIAIETGSK